MPIEPLRLATLPELFEPRRSRALSGGLPALEPGVAKEQSEIFQVPEVQVPTKPKVQEQADERDKGNSNGQKAWASVARSRPCVYSRGSRACELCVAHGVAEASPPRPILIRQ